MLCDRVLTLLWSLSISMRISLYMIWFKGVFYVCTDLLKTYHSLTKKKNCVFLEKKEFEKCF